MATIAELKRFILTFSDGTQEMPINVHQLAAQFGCPVRHVCDALVELFEQKFISLKAWDGHARVSFDEWRLPSDFFDSGLDMAVWVLLRAAGKEALEAAKAEEDRA